jgi:hypothetical protein
MQKKEVIRCAGVKSNGKPCHRMPYKAGLLYCNVHMVQDIGTNVKDIDSTGLVLDTWRLVVEELSLWDLRSLYLTCKSLYGAFVVQDWFVSHPRYIRCGKVSEYQDGISMRCTHDDTGRLYFDGSDFLSIGRLALEPDLYVVNNHFAARQIFHLQKCKRQWSPELHRCIYVWKVAAAFQFECTASRLQECYYDIMINSKAERIKDWFSRGISCVVFSGVLSSKAEEFVAKVLCVVQKTFPYSFMRYYDATKEFQFKNC